MTTSNDPRHNANGGYAADDYPEHLKNASITIMSGPTDAPHENIMAATVVAKLPRKVLSVIARSKSKTESKISEKSFLLCFSTPYWYKNLEKVNSYLTTDEYAPWNNTAVSLEVVGKYGNKVTWDPCMHQASDIDEASTTEETHQLFLGELDLYTWACYTKYPELKARSLNKLRSKFPILALEALELVNFICNTPSDLPPEEGIKQLAIEAVGRQKKQVAQLPNFTKVFEKAIGNNFAAKLLEKSQRERLIILDAEQFMHGPKAEINEPSQQRAIRLDSELLEQYISSGRLYRANVDGCGTLLPAALDGLGRPIRNENFRFRTNDLLVLDPRGRTFNPPVNVVVENLHGQSGDIRKDFLSPWSLKPSPCDQPGTPSQPKAMLQTDHTRKRFKLENLPGNATEEEKRAQRRARFRSPTPELKQRSSSPSPPDKPDRWTDAYGRR